MKEHSIADAYTALDVITCQIQDTDTLGTSCAQEVREVLDDYFALVKHLKNTPLWDVLTYEDRLESPIRILAADNERLREETNELLEKLGKTEKYRLSTEEVPEQEFHVGDCVRSKVLRANGVVYFVGVDGVVGAIFAMKSLPKTFSCKVDDLILIKRGDELE